MKHFQVGGAMGMVMPTAVFDWMKENVYFCKIINKYKIKHIANISFKMIYVEGGTFTMGVRGDTYRENIAAILRRALDIMK